MSELAKILPRESLPEEIVEIAKEKDFKASPESFNAVLKKFESQKGGKIKKASLANLRQFSDKAVSEESKETSLKNLKPPSLKQRKDDMDFPDTVRNPELIRNCLTKDEIIFFIDRWQSYYSEYGDDLNSANDYDQLVELIMNYVDLYRIQKKKKNSESAVTDPAIADIQHKSSNRIQALLTSLKTRRKDRIDMNIHNADNIVKLLCARAKDDEEFSSKVYKLTQQQVKEEEDFIKRKKIRGNTINDSDVILAEAELIE